MFRFKMRQGVLRSLALPALAVIAIPALVFAVGESLIFFFCDVLPDPPGCEISEGFGGGTLGCAPETPPTGPGVITVAGTTPADLDNAILAANAATPGCSPTMIVFPANQTIRVSTTPKLLTANNVTILGYGATIRGDDMCSSTITNLPCTVSADCGCSQFTCTAGKCKCPTCAGALLDIRGHNVVLRDLHVRNSGNDNIRVQGPNAYNVTISHVSSTGAVDDGISISNKCTPIDASLPPDDWVCTASSDFAAPHHVTVQYSFVAGNTRTMFVKANNPRTHPDNVSIYHNWFAKQWVRGPYIYKGQNVDFVNNVIEDWAEWGTKFGGTAAENATGNMAYNIFRQNRDLVHHPEYPLGYAVELGQYVDPQCRASTTTCALRDPLPATCKYVVSDPNKNNQKKGFNLASEEVPGSVFTGTGVDHTNWYLGTALWIVDGTHDVFPMPRVNTLHYYGDVEYEARTRSGPCVLTAAQIAAWRAGQPITCPRHPIDQAYLDATTWCVNTDIPFRPAGL